MLITNFDALIIIYS